uniref:Uncharacterized protein n=1 Tax=Candidatus Kentrum sp. TC TaxID=2126339 RepID=A0A450YLC8_9GAMM|nr:MAG: hypothetical protein BECKTC1821D_GA0114238_101211 [Candidatus Kentron sp. TC]
MKYAFHAFRQSGTSRGNGLLRVLPEGARIGICERNLFHRETDYGISRGMDATDKKLRRSLKWVPPYEIELRIRNEELRIREEGEKEGKGIGMREGRIDVVRAAL